jgi:hypothetical protein
MPLPGGNSMSTHCFVDANHAGNAETRRSQTGVLLFCNKAPTVWFSKRHNSVEASTFGLEFPAMKNAVEMIEVLGCKLRVFGVPIEGPTNVFCDNGAVCANATRPESTLTKKHHSIACHPCSREAVAAGTVRVSKEHRRPCRHRREKICQTVLLTGGELVCAGFLPPLGGFPMSSRPAFDRQKPKLDVPSCGILSKGPSQHADECWRRQHVDLHASGCVQAWNPECARQKARPCL